MLKVTSTKLGSISNDKIIKKCKSYGESIAEYIRNLILPDLNEDNQVPKLRITSIDDIPYQNGELNFEDEEIEIED